MKVKISITKKHLYLFAIIIFVIPVLAQLVSHKAEQIKPGTLGQNYTGNWTIMNGSIIINDSMCLGGECRTNWPFCTWEGRKCTCDHDDDGDHEMHVILGITCNDGSITDIDVMQMKISDSADCPSSFSGCNYYSIP